MARIAVDVPLPHLDRPFDYLVPESLADVAGPGCRVRVRFAGRLTGGYLLERADRSDHAGKLAFLERVVSPEPVLGPELAGLARAVADRYGGTLADVLRLAIPPRHAAVERAPVRPGVPEQAPPFAAPEPGPWSRYVGGPSFLAALAGGRSPRAIWSALPGSDGTTGPNETPGVSGAAGTSRAPAPGAPGAPGGGCGGCGLGVVGWAGEVALAAAAALASGRGALIVVPDATDLAAVDLALGGVLGAGRHVSLSAQLGPAERYRRWLAVARGQVRVVAGTRSAAFAPVARLGLVVIWDDGDDLHAEPRAPYPHARDVLLLRAYRAGAGALLGGFARTAEAAQLLATGWAKPLEAARSEVRRHAPLVRAAGEDAELARDEAARTARIPGLALRTAREALVSGPVLFQVPRRGYLAAVACQRCQARIRCAACAGPVALSGPGRRPACGWCGTPAPGACAACGATGLRAVITGARRTAEELGRAFPAIPVRTSSGEAALGQVPGSPAIVIATPGAEPRAEGGYAAAILLDGWALLGRASLRAAEEALRRWMNAAALVRPGPAGGRVVVLADPALAPVQALIRWDAGAHAARELAEREELRFPPAVRVAALTGPEDVVRGLLGSVTLPAGAQLLGPVPAGPWDTGGGSGERGEAATFLVRISAAAGGALAVTLRAGLAERSARKEPGAIRLQLDPAELA